MKRTKILVKGHKERMGISFWEEKRDKSYADIRINLPKPLPKEFIDLLLAERSVDVLYVGLSGLAVSSFDGKIQVRVNQVEMFRNFMYKYCMARGLSLTECPDKSY